MRIFALVDFEPKVEIKEIESFLKQQEAVIVESKGSRYILDMDVYEIEDASSALYYTLEGAGFPHGYEFEIMYESHYDGIDMISE